MVEDKETRGCASPVMGMAIASCLEAGALKPFLPLSVPNAPMLHVIDEEEGTFDSD